ncbi:ABC transporter permease [Mangrovibrevibacter kandeliae]|uniref:ABC transporter permease n=1 Tax=Mangrovibrevibacter kandeliae TaxID=2968473 RepID=UPI0021182ACB|nr:ABC transporter permease [Aurantimonas sp. CSK15Z-1]MCQ8782814.1 ABC transporter permease [Aurantimonas sp. CSK15Z-1]
MRGAPMESQDVYNASETFGGKLAEALADLWAGARLWHTWCLLGWRDFLQETKRTALGPLWAILGLAVTVAALGYVYGALLSWPPSEGYPYITAGLTCWFFISACIQGGSSVFISSAGILKERALPISFSVYRYTLRLFIEFCIKFVVFIGVALLVGIEPTSALLFLIPGLLLYFLNGIWVNLIFGIVGAGFRDVSQLISPIMLIVFLATPILWPQTALGGQGAVAEFNPFTHFIAVIRDPLLGSVPSHLSLAVVVATLVGGWLLTFLAFIRYKNKIVFWL